MYARTPNTRPTKRSLRLAVIAKMVTLTFNGLFCYYIKLLYCLRQAWFMSPRRAHSVNIIDVDDAAASLLVVLMMMLVFSSTKTDFYSPKYKSMASKKKLLVIVHTIFKNPVNLEFLPFFLPFQPFKNNNSRTGVEFNHFDDASKKQHISMTTECRRMVKRNLFAYTFLIGMLFFGFIYHL